MAVRQGPHLVRHALVDQMRQEASSCSADWLVVALVRPHELEAQPARPGGGCVHVHACVYQYACFYVYLSECACVHERVLENVCVCAC